jgi:hypothetical protein
MATSDNRFHHTTAESRIQDSTAAYISFAWQVILLILFLQNLRKKERQTPLRLSGMSIERIAIVAYRP